MSNLLQKTLVHVLIASLLALGSPLAVEAGVIGTLEAVASARSDSDLATINAALAHQQVRAQMHALGVDAGHVEARLARLTAPELRALAERLDSAPAGAGILEVVGIVFIVLLILEAVGVIDVFKKFP